MKRTLVIFLSVCFVLASASDVLSLENAGLKGKYSRNLDNILDLPPEQIDLGTAVLIISEQWSEFVYGRQYVRRLDEMAREIKEEIEERKLEDSPQAINVINKYLFEKKGFESVEDANKPGDLLLHSVMDKKQGYCLSLSVLYLTLAERVGLPVYGVVVPEHFFVRYDDGENRYNIETTSGGSILSDEHYVKKFDVPDTDTIYMQNLNKKQVLGCFFNNLGNSYNCIGDYNSAMKALTNAVEINPTLAESRINLANLYIREKRFREALEQYQRACRLNPRNSQAHQGLANIFLRMEQPRKAISEYRKMLKLDSDAANVYESLAIAYRQVGDIAKAKELLERALVWKPNDTGLLIQLGDTLYEAGNFQDAVLQYRMSLGAGETPQAYLGLAKCYRELGDEESRIQAYRDALRLNPDMVSALTGLAEIYFDRKDYAGAERLYKKAVNIRGGESSLYHNLAACYSNQEKYELAEKNYKKALELDPQAAGAHNGLAITYYNLEEYEPALKHLETARKLGYDVQGELLETLEQKVGK